MLATCQAEAHPLADIAKYRLGHDGHSDTSLALRDTRRRTHGCLAAPRSQPPLHNARAVGALSTRWPKAWAGPHEWVPGGTVLLSLSWHQGDSANVPGAGKSALILGFLHHHQGCSAWTAAPGNLFGKTNRNVFCIGSLAARMGLAALRPVN